MTLLDRLGSERIAILCAMAGLIGCGIGLLLDARTMLAAYLAAWMTIAAIPIGGLAVLLVSYLVPAGWTRDLGSLLSTAALSTPAIAVLFIPILLGLHELYPWAAGHIELPAFKTAYLTMPFFITRAVVYFAIFSAIGYWAAKAYGDDAHMTRSGAGGLIVWSLVASLSGIDWIESLEPQFHSSIYGLLILSFYLLGGLAFAITALFATRRPRRMNNTAYAAILLAMILLWAYLHAMQYIIIWAGNLPDEVVWYLERLRGGWGVVLWALCAGQFIVPFFALLSPQVRASSRALLAIAASTLTLRLVEAALLVLPPLHVAAIKLALGIPVALLLIASVWFLAWRRVTVMTQQRRSAGTMTALP